MTNQYEKQAARKAVFEELAKRMAAKEKQQLADELVASIFQDKKLRAKSYNIARGLARKMIKNQYYQGPARERWLGLIAQMGKPGHFHPYSVEIRSLAANQMTEFFEDEIKRNTVGFLYEVAGVEPPATAKSAICR